jgi:hypothetical protein
VVDCERGMRGQKVRDLVIVRAEGALLDAPLDS